VLKNCLLSAFARPGAREPYGFVLSSFGRDYHFATEDASERDRWMTVILAVCSAQSALAQDEILAVAFDLQPVLQQVVAIQTLVHKCLDYFSGKPTIDVDSPPWFADFASHVTAVVDGAMAAAMLDSSPVRLYLLHRLKSAATPENCMRVTSLCLQQLCMPAILPELLTHLGHPRGNMQQLTEQFAAKCRLVAQHPNFFDSLNLPSRECGFEIGVKLMGRLPLLTDPHALLSAIVSVVESAQNDLKLLLGPRAPVLNGDHMFCFFLYFIVSATPAPHHFLSEVVSLFNSHFNLEGPRGYIAATYCAAVTYIISFSSSIQRKASDDFVLAASSLRHVPSKRFTRRLASFQQPRSSYSLGSGSADVQEETAVASQQQLRPYSSPATGCNLGAALDALLDAQLDASSSDEEAAEVMLSA
jgi:hypothetical protein